MKGSCCLDEVCKRLLDKTFAKKKLILRYYKNRNPETSEAREEKMMKPHKKKFSSFHRQNCKKREKFSAKIDFYVFLHFLWNCCFAVVCCTVDVKRQSVKHTRTLFFITFRVWVKFRFSPSKIHRRFHERIFVGAQRRKNSKKFETGKCEKSFLMAFEVLGKILLEIYWYFSSWVNIWSSSLRSFAYAFSSQRLMMCAKHFSEDLESEKFSVKAVEARGRRKWKFVLGKLWKNISRRNKIASSLMVFDFH